MYIHFFIHFLILIQSAVGDDYWGELLEMDEEGTGGEIRFPFRHIYLLDLPIKKYFMQTQYISAETGPEVGVVGERYNEILNKKSFHFLYWAYH